MRINCGGFELNENDFELDGETLSLKNSGGGGGSSSCNTLVVTIYADDMVDDPNNVNKPNVILKMNRTYNEILNAYETGKNVDFIFEAKRMPLSGHPFDSTLTLVLHNNHSTLESYGISIHVYSLSIDVVTEATYSSIRPSENEYVLNGRPSLSIATKVALAVNASSQEFEYGVYINMEGFNFEGPFTCQNGNDYPSYVADGSLK